MTTQTQPGILQVVSAQHRNQQLRDQHLRNLRDVMQEQVSFFFIYFVIRVIFMEDNVKFCITEIVSSLFDQN